MYDGGMVLGGGFFAQNPSVLLLELLRCRRQAYNNYVLLTPARHRRLGLKVWKTSCESRSLCRAGSGVPRTVADRVSSPNCWRVLKEVLAPYCAWKRLRCKHDALGLLGSDA